MDEKVLGAYGIQVATPEEAERAESKHPAVLGFFDFLKREFGIEHTYVKGGLKPLSGGSGRRFAQYNADRDEFTTREVGPPPEVLALQGFLHLASAYCVECGHQLYDCRCRGSLASWLRLTTDGNDVY